MSSRRTLDSIFLAANFSEAVYRRKVETTVGNIIHLDHTYTDILDIPTLLGGSTEATLIEVESDSSRTRSDIQGHSKAISPVA